ncbi:hypothetical protein Dimus_037419, partial [Dionaea muscipula]
LHTILRLPLSSSSNVQFISPASSGQMLGVYAITNDTSGTEVENTDNAGIDNLLVDNTAVVQDANDHVNIGDVSDAHVTNVGTSSGFKNGRPALRAEPTNEQNVFVPDIASTTAPAAANSVEVKKYWCD